MTLVLAFIAGFVTVLSPCVLPLLPVILASAVQEGRLRPWGVLAGFVISFAAITLLLATLVSSIGLHPDALRLFSGIILLICGVVLAVPQLGHWFEMRTGSIAGLSARFPDNGGFWGGLVLGSGLGLAWTPCVGPIMASVITMALNQSVTGGAVAVTLAYAIGTAIPMGAVIFGGRALVRRVSFLQRHTVLIRSIFGALLILAAVLILTGFDRTIQTWLLINFPDWESVLTGWEPEI
ncbi:cytochrome c biogenesis CcdA family protein [Devosia sp. 2618]|uniref:cytochrome c biogenesis CcdA family protein n=1 Tax=Devosia sp. 2618 TaxID=3156454 RepID=UPI00339AAB4C